MNHKLVTLLWASLAAVPLAAQDDARVTNSLAFRHGGKIALRYDPVPIKGGVTLRRLMDAEGGARAREAWNNRFQRAVDGELELATTTELGGNKLDPGEYALSFGIDDDLIWSLIVLTPESDVVCTIPLDVQQQDTTQEVLTLAANATDNSKGDGVLAIAFGSLEAAVPFHVEAAEGGSSEPGENANMDAPMESNTLSQGGETVEVAYRELMLSGGKSLKGLLNPEGSKLRTFYNEQYLPQVLAGRFTTTCALELGDATLAPGDYEFTFRIDDDLTWHLIVLDGDHEVANVALESTSDAAGMAKRLAVRPIPAASEGRFCVLAIRYGPLSSELPMGSGAARIDEAGSDK